MEIWLINLLWGDEVSSTIIKNTDIPDPGRAFLTACTNGCTLGYDPIISDEWADFCKNTKFDITDYLDDPVLMSELMRPGARIDKIINIIY